MQDKVYMAETEPPSPIDGLREARSAFIEYARAASVRPGILSAYCDTRAHMAAADMYYYSGRIEGVK